VKVFCFSDIHIGPCRYQFVKDQEDRLVEWVLENVRKNECDRVLFLGDCFRERWHSGREKDRVWLLFKEISSKVDVVLIAGNHDYYDKNCQESSLVVFRNMSSVMVVDEDIQKDRIARKDVVHVPWKCSLQRGKLEGDILFGHFELREAVSWDGEGQVTLRDFDRVGLVISGHLHFRKKVGNVLYIGVPFQRGFGDAVEGGGMVVDLEDMSYSWVDGYGVKFVQIDKEDDLYRFDVNKCYVRVKDIRLVERVKKLGVVGVEYVPEQVTGYSEDMFQEWEREIKKIDLWGLLGEYGRQVLKVGDRELEWLRQNCGEESIIDKGGRGI
jgi:DNA repair exonuclease SbcCD nuclease subunit